jgi:hypothetical protein
VPLDGVDGVDGEDRGRVPPEPATVDGNGAEAPAVEQEPVEPAAADGHPAEVEDGKSSEPAVAPDKQFSMLGSDGPKKAHRVDKDRIVVHLQAEREDVQCDLCGRTVLKGEPVQPFMAPPGIWSRKSGGNGHDHELGFLTLSRFEGRQYERRMVCELCWPVADEAGWAPLPTIRGHGSGSESK